MRGLGGPADSVAEMPDVHRGVSDFVDGGQHRDARRNAPASDGGNFVPGLSVFAGLSVGRGTETLTGTFPGAAMWTEAGVHLRGARKGGPRKNELFFRNTFCKGFPHVGLASAEEFS